MKCGKTIVPKWTRLHFRHLSIWQMWTDPIARLRASEEKRVKFADLTNVLLVNQENCSLRPQHTHATPSKHSLTTSYNHAKQGVRPSNLGRLESLLFGKLACAGIMYLSCSGKRCKASWEHLARSPMYTMPCMQHAQQEALGCSQILLLCFWMTACLVLSLVIVFALVWDGLHVHHVTLDKPSS